MNRLQYILRTNTWGPGMGQAGASPGFVCGLTVSLLLVWLVAWLGQ